MLHRVNSPQSRTRAKQLTKEDLSKVIMEEILKLIERIRDLQHPMMKV